MSQASALYAGGVVHQRLRPRRHRLERRVFWLLLDLSELDGLDRRLRWFSRNRWNLFAFFDRDHGDGSDRPLRVQVEARLAAIGVDLEGGAIRLLTMPRMLGYVFNPISVYYCHDADGRLAAVSYEVSNTFGERHFYDLAVSSDGADAPFRQSCAKALYVSPFMEMEMRYRFRGRTPGDRIGLVIGCDDASGPLLTASLWGRRRPLADLALARAALTYPAMTLKVVAAIHWEALILWLKGVPVTLGRRPKLARAA
ncbi:MAG: DUF1365 family protein [Brevundimonas sp.]|uniref:DUF1365 domain-containing protein n=1 Tax=Brevundimonas sp. TaxID=1871086 RepID=UPI002629B34D|nr:DUF1365 family protein [Brevundimonas sp.]MDI6624922.1 DUF1365 family protein [Brevundimonas sp.]MDQ7811370.1 DUF1365 family protein [Brevundimonas sp.]